MLEENSFGALLEYFRKRSKLILARQGIGWTQKGVAEALEVSERTYKSWERGERVPDQHYLKKIAALFRLGTEDEDRLYREASQAPPRTHNLPFPRNPLFTGRNAQLKQLGQLVKENYSVALTGLAGIGKTQIALEYAHRCYIEKVYQAVFWVSAADERSLQTGYAALAEKLDLPERDEQELAKIVKAVKEWLERHTHWLLIMDNADNLSLARSFFPKAPETHQGHILLTTRWQMVGNIARKINIDRMEPEEGRDFLLRRSAALQDATIDTRHAASQIVELLDGHPLALDQAGAFIEDGSSFADYINLYHEKRCELLDERGSLDEESKGKYSEYPDTVFVTFGLCFDKARERHPITTDILRFCAFCHPDIIPYELLQHDETFKRDATEFKQGRTALLRYSLLKRNALDYTLPWDRLENTLSMHRLVQDVIIDAMSADLQKQWRERVVRALNAAFPEKDSDFYYGNLITRCRRLLPHVLLCAAWTDDELAQTVEVAKLLYKAASYLQDRYQHSDAEPLLARVLSIYEQHIGVGHSITASELSGLAALYRKQGKREQAEALYRQGLAIREKNFGIEHLETALSLYNLAVLYFEQSKDDQAVSLFLQVLKICGQRPVAKYSYIIDGTVHALAALLSWQGKHEQSETYYQILDQQEQQLEDQQYGMEATPVKVVRTLPDDRDELCYHLAWDMG